MTGLPGLRGLDHVGFTVPDMAAAIAFFTDVLGAEFILDGGVVEGASAMRDRLGVDPAARCRWCFLRLGTALNLELFEYTAPDQRREPPKNSDAGGHHLALYVDDMAVAVAHLREHGLAVMGEPETIAAGPAAGGQWVYVLAPWGLQLELCSYPMGKGPADGPARRLYDPRGLARP